MWIEIGAVCNVYGWCFPSLPARGVWIEIPGDLKDCIINASLPARGVWIEIFAILALATLV